MSEKLSNLLDKNVAQADLQEFLEQCKDDPSLVDSWQRYHLAGGIIRNEINDSDLKFDVAASVMSKLQNESFDSEQSLEDDQKVIPLAQAARKRQSTSAPKAKPWLPLALAASLLLGLFFVFQKPALEVTPPQLADNTSVDAVVAMPADQWQTSSSEVENILNSLLVEHSEFTSVTGMNGLGSYSKFIAYQN